MPAKKYPLTRLQHRAARQQGEEQTGERIGEMAESNAGIDDVREQLAMLHRHLASLASRLEASEVELEAERRRHQGSLHIQREMGDSAGQWGNVRLPRGGWLQNPFQDLAYTGKTDKTNPIRFLKSFENIASYEGVNDRDQQHYFMKCLKDRARTWYELQDFGNITEAKTAFREYFWGEEAQARYRERLYTGKYSVTEKLGTMAEYAMSLVRDAKLLEPPMSDYEVIRTVKRHFECDIRREIRPSTVRSVKDLIDLLEDIEERGDRGADQSTERWKKRTRDVEIGSKPQLPASQRLYLQGDRRNYYQANPQQRGLEYRTERARELDRRLVTQPQIEFPDSEVEKGKVYQEKKPTESHKNRGQDGGSNRERGGTRDRRKITIIETQADAESVSSGSTEGEGPDEPEEEEQGEMNIMRTREILRELDEDAREVRAKVKECEPFVSVSIGGEIRKALVDTGAQVSAITKDLYDELIAKGIFVDTVPIKKLALKGAFSEKGSSVAYKAQLTLRMKGKVFVQEFCVVPRMIHPLVLGIDFLNEYKATIVCGGEMIEISFDVDAKHMMQMEVLTAEEAQRRLSAVLVKHREIFEGRIGKVTHYQHKIEVTSEAAYKAKTYPIPEVHREKVRQHLAELEDQGIVKRAPTQFVNPLVAVVKRTGEIRMCLDARELNKRMVNDYAQPPSIDEVFRRIGARKYFSTLDVAQAFWQIPLKEGSEQYTGFLFDNQTYVFRRMPFGIKTAGASFTRAMQLALGNDCDGFVITYLDDILIASHTLSEHLKHIELVLEKLRTVGFCLNRDRCEFMQTEIRFLGHTFSEVEAQINQETKLAVESFQRPRNKKAIQSFLGLVNWDRRFVRNLASFTKPLEELLKKEARFRWTEDEQVAFDRIKGAFASAPTLFLVRPGMRFGIQVDASVSGLGARLFQYDEQGREYTIAYASRSTKGAEVNYTVTELECLALVWALRKWCAVLMGRHVRVRTDHRALKFMTACVQSSARIARWMAFLQEFDLEIEHIPGKDNGVADVLSRRNRDESINSGAQSEKYIAFVIKPEQDIDTQSWVGLIGEAQSRDVKLKTRVEREPERYETREGLVRVRKENGSDKIEIPQGVARTLLERIHAFLLHFGTDKVVSFAKTYFAVPGLERLARDVVASCHVCIASKYYTRPSAGQQYYTLPDRPGLTVSIDIFGPLPTSTKRNKYVIVLMDHFSKFVRFFPVRNQKLDTIMGVMEEKYFVEVGIPETVVSDRGGQFVAARWEQFGREHGFAVRRTSAYNPQSTRSRG